MEGRFFKDNLSILGDVGVGTNNPRGPFEVYAASDATLVIERFTSNGIQLRADNSVDSAIRLGFEAYTYEFKNGSGTSRLHINSSGNVGIGTAVPDDKLDVVGQFRISANKSATTNKTNRIRGEHYDITEEPVTFMFMNSFSTTNTLYIGGGSSVENAATQLNFFTAANNTTTTGTLRMLIQSDGNVGIGTASPSQKLHVQGNLRVTGAYYDSNNEAGTSNQVLTSTGLGGTDWKSLSQIGDTVTGCGTTNKITKWSDGPNSDLTDSSFLSESGTTLTNTATVTEFTTTNTQLRLPNYGRVAIGAASTNSVLLANVGDNATFSNGEAVIKGENSGNRGTVGHASGSDLLRLNFSDALGMILNKDGHVGIGNAVSQVYTNENTSTVNLRVGSDTVSTNQSSTIQIGGHDSSGCGTLGAIEFFNRRDYSIVAKIQVRRDLESSTKLSAGQIDFYTDDGDNNLNARMSIDALGNVGIGTTIPTQKLYVAGNAVVNGDIHLETAGDCITFYGNCNGNHSITSRDANGAVADDLRINTYGSLFINLDSNVNNTDCADFMIGRHGTSTISDWLFTLNGETGNVGIGTTSPDACLHLQGNAHLQVGSTTGGQSAVMGSTSTTDAGALNYRAYWSYDSYWDHDTCLWNAKRATLGRKWKAEMSYHDDHFQISRQGNVCTTWANSDWSNFFTINNVGNVGIGTTSPALQSGGTGLHINDTTNSELKFTNNTTGATASDGTALVASGSTFTLNNREAGSIKLGTSNTTRVTIDSAGNVGIGTTIPGGKLDVNGMIKAGIAGNSSANTPALLVSSAGVNPEQSAIAIQQGTTEGDTIIFADYEPYVEWGLSTDNGLNTIEFTGGTNTNNLGSKTLYNQSGNARTAYKKAIVELTSGNMSVGGSVGIGTANPASVSQTPRLAVVHNGAGIATFDATGAGGGYITITDSNTPLAYLGSSYQLISSNGAITDTALRSQGELVFATGGSSERMRIDSSGKVGIGTATPSQKLHIVGNLRVTGAYYDSNNEAGTSDQVLTSTGSGGTDWKSLSDIGDTVTGCGTTNYVTKWCNGPNSDLTNSIIYDNGTDVGISTASPSAKLHVHSTTGILHTGDDYDSWVLKYLSNQGSGSAVVNYYLIAAKTQTNVRFDGVLKGARQVGTSATGSGGARITFYTNNAGTPLATGGLESWGTDVPSYGHPIFKLVELTYNSVEYYAIEISPSASWAAAFTHVQFEGYANNVLFTNLGTASVSGVAEFSGEESVFSYKYGKLGIGTGSPIYKLDINDDAATGTGLRVTGGGTGGSIARFTRDVGGTGDININAANSDPQIQFYDGDVYFSIGLDDSSNSFKISNSTAINTNDLVTILTDGNVGIGTTSPDDKLHVVQSVDLNTALFKNTSGRAQVIIDSESTAHNSYLTLSNGGSEFAFLDAKTSTNLLRIATNITGAEIAIETNTQDEAVRIDSTGKVGIGTDNPSEELHVFSSSDPTIKIGGGVSDGTTGGTAKLHWSANNGIVGNGFFATYYKDATNDRLTFIDGGAVNVLTLENGGKLGIGTTSPANNLTVAGDIGYTGYLGQGSIYGNAANASYARVQLYDPATGYTTFNNISYGYYFQTANSTKVTILNNGNVGIGTTAPAQQLEITKNFRLPNSTATTGIIYKDTSRFIHNFSHPSGSTAIPTGRNTFVGANAGNLTIGSTATSTNHGSFNNGVGFQALISLTTGYSNDAFGHRAGLNLTSGFDNALFGYLSGYDLTTGIRNTFLGSNAGQNIATTSYNIAVGYSALLSDNSGVGNTVIGSLAADATIGSDYLVTIGYQSLSNITSGSYNVALGYRAGLNNTVAGNLLNAEYGVFIGPNTNPTEGSTNEIVIGNGADGNGSNTATLGNDSITKTILKGNVGIGTTSPDSKLHIDSTGEPLRFTRTGQETYRLIHGVSGLYFSRPDSGGLSFGVSQNDTFDIFDTSGTVMFRADSSSGNVGIGTTSPQAKLEVNTGDIFTTNSLSGSVLLMPTGASGGTYGAGLVFGMIRTDADAGAAISSVGKFGDSDPAGLAFFYHGSSQSSGRTEGMRIDSSGNVGIGTTNPSTDFSVKEHLLFNDSTRLLTISNNTNTGGINLDGNNTRLYFSGYRALEGNNSGTTLTVGENYTTTKISSVLNVVDHETILSPDQGGSGGVASRALTIENINDSSWTTDALTSYNATTSYDIRDRASYSFFAAPKNGNILTFASETANNGTLHRFVNLNSSATEPLYRWDFYQYDGSGTGAGDFKVPDKLFQIRVREGVSNVEKFTIKGNGNVGISTTNPLFKLHVNGDIYQDAGGGIFSNSNRGWYRQNYVTTGAGVSNGKIVTLNPPHGQTASNVFHYIFELTTAGTSTNTGATYIGVYNADTSAWVLRAVSLSGGSSNHPQLSVSGNNFTVYTNHPSNYTVVVSVTTVYNGDADSTAHSLGANYQWQRAVNDLYYNDGLVGIGTGTPSQKLHVQGNLRLTGALYDSNNQTGSSGEILSSTGSGTDWVSLCQISGVTANGSQSTCYIPKWTDGTNEVIGNSVIYENASGNIGINCTTPSYKLHVNGSFAATCKSFVIDHPTKCGHMLRYGSLESPYHGVRLTGKSCTIGGEAKISLPDYMCGLVHKEDVNVQITNYRHGCTMWVDDVDISNNNFRVKTETEETKEFYWTFTAERKDVDRMQTEYKNV